LAVAGVVVEAFQRQWLDFLRENLLELVVAGVEVG
jgi:hypothetical protein